jgi:5'-3' exonuclease
MGKLSRLRDSVKGLDNQFAVTSSGVTALIDGDILAYNVTAKVAKLSTAIRRFQQEVLKAIFLTGAQRGIVHLTSSGSTKNKRKEIVAAKPYQGNRDGKNKPPLLEALRSTMCREENWLNEFECHLWSDIEADDALMMDSYRLKDRGIMYSADKDLRQTPYPYYEIKTGRVFPTLEGIGWVDIRHTEGGAGKLTGHGEKFLWAQMLSGDRIDNVLGLARKADGRRVGDTTAVNLLHDVEDPDDMVDRVIYLYNSIGQNPVPELWLLYLLQEPGKTAVDYLMSFDLTHIHKVWIDKQIKAIEWNE